MKKEEKPLDVLLLDDDVDLLTSTAELLAESGYRVKGYADPESALEFAMDQSFTLGLFDFRLGSLKNGLDVIETLQALGNKAQFMLITADVEPSTAMRAANLKIHGLLRKPLAPEQLLDTVDRALNASRLAA